MTEPIPDDLISDDLNRYLVPIFKRKVKSIVAINVKHLSAFTDTLIIIECNSLRQVNATAQYLMKTLRKKKIKPLGMEGVKNSEWALLDYGDAVIHIFESKAKKFYDIEGLWADAPRVDLVEYEKTYGFNAESEDEY